MTGWVGLFFVKSACFIYIYIISGGHNLVCVFASPGSHQPALPRGGYMRSPSWTRCSKVEPPRERKHHSDSDTPDSLMKLERPKQPWYPNSRRAEKTTRTEPELEHKHAQRRAPSSPTPPTICHCALTEMFHGAEQTSSGIWTMSSVLTTMRCAIASFSFSHPFSSLSLSETHTRHTIIVLIKSKLQGDFELCFGLADRVRGQQR